ncbi:MAG: serine--tRNA ligase, partial [Acetobacteraceae bacterium]|nr:serine--tRNA ligase [Acetobacteraceae bacterium]
MHDIRAIRADPARFDAAMARRGETAWGMQILERDAEHRATLTKLQDLQARGREISKQVGEGRRKGSDTAELEGEAAKLRSEIETLETQAQGQELAIRQILESVPNILDPDVPDGPDE